MSFILTHKKELEIMRAINPFGAKVFNETINLLIHCKKRGVSPSDLMKFWRRNQERLNVMREGMMRYYRTCPKCSHRVYLTAVTEPQGKANVHGWRSIWWCSNPECNWEEFSLEKTKEEAKKYPMEGREDG